MTTKTDRTQDERTRRWAAALRLGMAVAERADDIDGAAAVQILDANGQVLFNADLGSVR